MEIEEENFTTPQPDLIEKELPVPNACEDTKMGYVDKI